MARIKSQTDLVTLNGLPTTLFATSKEKLFPCLFGNQISKICLTFQGCDLENSNLLSEFLFCYPYFSSGGFTSVLINKSVEEIICAFRLSYDKTELRISNIIDSWIQIIVADRNLIKDSDLQLLTEYIQQNSGLTPSLKLVESIQLSPREDLDNVK